MAISGVSAVNKVSEVTALEASEFILMLFKVIPRCNNQNLFSLFSNY